MIPKAFSCRIIVAKLHIQHLRSWITSGEQVQRERLVRPSVS